MTQDLIPVRREDVEYFAELVRCRALSLPEPHKSQEREILTRLSAALNVPPSAEPTRLYLPPDADAAHHALDSMYSESVTGDKYMEAYELVSHFIRAAGAPSLSETTKDHIGEIAGWKLVPIEPTEEMKDAAHEMKRGRFIEPGPKSYWDAMVNAAPTTHAVQT